MDKKLINNSTEEIRFKSIDGCLTAIKDQPKGVIQFIGSFIFGSFPKCSYKPLFQYLWSQGYTLVIHKFPFRPFNVNHWNESVNLQKRNYEAIIYLVQQAQGNPELVDFYLDSNHYRWLGHSLGCKYILLLELLSDSTDQKVLEVVGQCLTDKEKKDVEDTLACLREAKETAQRKLSKITSKDISLERVIRNQMTVLMAPEYSTTLTLFNKNIPVGNPFTQPFPNAVKIEEIIKLDSNILNLSGLISFYCDPIAKDDSVFLKDQLKTRHPFNFSELIDEYLGGHFAPQGNQYIEIADSVLRIYSTLSH